MIPRATIIVRNSEPLKPEHLAQPGTMIFAGFDYGFDAPIVVFATGPSGGPLTPIPQTWSSPWGGYE